MMIRLTRSLLPLLLFATSLPAQLQPTQRATVQAALNTPSLAPSQRAVATITLNIIPPFHAQSHTPLDQNLIPTEVTLAPNTHIKPDKPIYPPGQTVTYPALGKLSVYSNQVTIQIPFTVSPSAPPGPLKLTGELTYQICDEKSCYAPETTPFTITTTVTSSSAPPPPPPHLTATPPEKPATALYWFSIAFLAGIFFNIMPCVLPVLPLKALSFYEVSQHHRDKCLLLGLVFSAGIVAFFAAIAVIILVFKSLTWGQQFSNPYFVWGIVILLTIMALAMFGLLNFNLPTGVYRFTPRHDTYTGNFLFGIFTAILSTPCTAPLFPPLMLWAHAQPVAIGIPAVMMVGVGMAFPYLLLSAFPQLAQNFPRTGPWSELVKQMMGFLLLVAAVYFAAGQLIEGPSFWYAVLAITAIACLFLLARTTQLAKGALPLAVSSTLAVAAFASILTITLRVTGLFRPTTTSSATASHSAWTPYSPQALESALKQNKIALVKFTANWCLNCQYIESTVFGDSTTLATLQQNNVVLLKADMTRKNPPAQQLLIKLNPAGGIPLTAIYSPKLEKPLTLDSVYTAQTLLNAITQAKPPAAMAAQ
ncbi:MAG: thioredoxin family protein [Planctomycetota bacterium]|nr:thioredoxin family protein [Planctomycetota bacterium]